MKEKFSMATYIVNALGFSISITDIENVLNLILLIVSIASTLIVAGISIYDKFKKKDLDGVIDEVQDTADKITDIIEVAKGGDENDDKGGAR